MSLLMPESTLPIRRRSDPFLAKRHSAHVVWTYRRDTNAALREHLHPHSTLLPRILRQDVTKTINKPMDALMAASENLDEDLETLTAHFWDIFFRFFSSPTNSISVDQAARLVTHSDFSDMATSPCMLAELDECRNLLFPDPYNGLDPNLLNSYIHNDPSWNFWDNCDIHPHGSGDIMCRWKRLNLLIAKVINLQSPDRRPIIDRNKASGYVLACVEKALRKEEDLGKRLLLNKFWLPAAFTYFDECPYIIHEWCLTFSEPGESVTGFDPQRWQHWHNTIRSMIDHLPQDLRDAGRRVLERFREAEEAVDMKRIEQANAESAACNRNRGHWSWDGTPVHPSGNNQLAASQSGGPDLEFFTEPLEIAREEDHLTRQALHTQWKMSARDLLIKPDLEAD